MSDNGNYSAVKGSHGVINPHDVRSARDIVISLFSLNHTKVELISKTELPVYGVDRVCYPDSDIFAEHKVHTFRNDPTDHRINMLTLYTLFPNFSILIWTFPI